MKEQQQQIYFRKFFNDKLWRNIKLKEAGDKYLQKKCTKSQNLRNFLPFKYDAKLFFMKEQKTYTL